ncbi:MAG: hypothetical protein AAB729_05805 [Patescibacteria group bacterium]
MSEKKHPTSVYLGSGSEDLSVFKPGEADQDLEAKLSLNMAVLVKAGEDLISPNKEAFLDAAYFLFSDDSKSVKEANSLKSFEAYSSRVGVDHKHFAQSIWKRLPLMRQNEIEQGLKEKFGIELPDDLQT